MPKAEQRIGIPQPDAELRRIVTATLKHPTKSRAQIADELSTRLGQKITVNMLNDFTSEAKKGARFPACFVTALCEITGNDELLRFLMGPRFRRLVEVGERQLEQQRMCAELLKQCKP